MFFDRNSFKICIENYIQLVFTYEENVYLFFRHRIAIYHSQPHVKGRTN